MQAKYFIVIGIFFFVFSLFLIVIAVQQRQQTQSTAAATGPLRVLSSNPRYFTDSSGRAIYLTGSHIWGNLVDNPFDWGGYLDFLQQHHHNFIRLWAWEAITPSSKSSLESYARPGPGTATDGKPKFDVNQFNPDYFARLRQRVLDAGNRGIYVGIMLFNGWSIEDKGEGNPWPNHPFNAANNINGINGDPNGDGQGHEVHTMAVPAITALQDTYVRKVIDTVNDLDNVLYEISNESNTDSVDWQYHMVDLIHSYEKSRPKQHPVGMTAIGYSVVNGQFKEVLNNTAVYNSHADWISPFGGNDNEGYLTNPPVANGQHVSLTDSDHAGWDNSATGAWKSFMRGHNPILMDEGLDSGFSPDPKWEPARVAMGQTKQYADKLNLAAMTPQNDLASTGYCLANPGSEYLVYQPGGGSFTVTLGAGTYAVEWFNPTAGQASTAGTVNGGSAQTFTPPFSGDAVLYLKNTSITGTPTSTATLTPTSIQPTFACIGSCPTNSPSPSPSSSLSTVPTNSLSVTPSPTNPTTSGNQPSVQLLCRLPLHSLPAVAELESSCNYCLSC